MDYIDLHADTLTEITSGDLTKNTADIDLFRIRKQFTHYTQIFAIWKDQAQVEKSRREEVFMQTYQRARALLADAGEEILLCQSFAEMEAAWKSGKAAAFCRSKIFPLWENMPRRRQNSASGLQC